MSKVQDLDKVDTEFKARPVIEAPPQSNEDRLYEAVSHAMKCGTIDPVICNDLLKLIKPNVPTPMEEDAISAMAATISANDLRERAKKALADAEAARNKKPEPIKTAGLPHSKKDA